MHHTPAERPASSLLLCSCLGLGCFLLVAVDHHNPYERANNGRSQESEDNGDSDGPDARREKVLERMARINEWLLKSVNGQLISKIEGKTYHKESPCGVVEEDRGSDQEHG